MKRSLKIVAALAGVLVVLVLAVVILPFVVDFNRFKPQIQAAVAERVNARIDFESARLTILTGLGVKLSKVTIENTDPKFAGTRLFVVDELVFRTALMPLLEKKFVGYVKIDRPEIVVVRQGLSNNVGALIKESEPAEGGAAGGSGGGGGTGGTDGTGGTGGTGGGKAPGGTDHNADEPPLTPEEREGRKAQIEELKRNVVIESLTIEDASLTLREVASGGAAGATGATAEPVRIRNLDLSVTNIGADRDVRVLLTTQAGVNQPGLRVNGPVELALTLKALTTGTEFKELDYSGRFTLDKMAINAANGSFSKAENVPLHAEFEGKAFPDAFELPRFKARLQSLELDLTASVKDFTRKDAKVTLKAASSDLAKLAEVLPKHRAYLVNASLDLDARLEGALETPDKVKTRVALKTVLTGTDITLNWNSDHIKPLQGRLTLDSKRLDAAGLIAPFTGGESAAADKGTADKGTADKGTADKGTADKGTADKGTADKGTAGAPAASMESAQEFALTPEQKELLSGSDVQARINVGELLYKDFRIVDLKLDAALEGLVARLKELSLQAFGGKTNIEGLVNLSTVPLAFRGKVDLNSVKAEEVLAFAVPEHKDVLAGRMSLDLNLDGRGSTFPTVSKTLGGKGSFVFQDGQLKTESIAGLAQQQFDEKVTTMSVVKAADDIVKAAEALVANPLVKQAGGLKGLDIEKYKKEYDSVRNVSIAEKGDIERTLKDVKGALEIRDGRIYLTSKNGGRDGELDFKGSVGLDLTLQGNAVFTAGEKLEQKMLSQSKYANLLLDDAGNLSLPMTLAGTVKAPKVKVDLDPLQARFTMKARALAETELRKKAQEEVDKLLKGQADKAIADLKKKAGEEGKKIEDKAKKEAEKVLGKDPKKALNDLFGKKK